jgi:hypothetical protein
MAYFPGNIMVIDDQYELVHSAPPQDADALVQYKALKGVKDFCESHGIPLLTISDTNDIGTMKARMELYSNVRMLIIDLDLNNDGNVSPEDDYETVRFILQTAIKRYGYFLLLINSAHAEAWEGIKASLPADITAKFLMNLTHSYDKKGEGNIYDSLDKIGENYSAELIYDFESFLSEARDKAFNSFLDFEKDSWRKIYQTLYKEGGEMANHDITSILMGILKQHLLGSKYSSISQEGQAISSDETIEKLVYQSLNYTFNLDKRLDSHPIWTGNLYETTLGHDRKYALIISPECDIANGKHLFYKIVFGFHADIATLPADYDPKIYSGENTAPLLAQRVGKKMKLPTKKDIASFGTSLGAHFYAVRHVASTPIYFDYRDVSSLLEAELINKKWKLLLRVNEPMITNILDGYSNLHNRKGLLSF